MRVILTLLLFLLFISLVNAYEYNGSISVSNAIGIVGIAYNSKNDGDECTTDSECRLNHVCKNDFDNVGKFCAGISECVHDYKDYNSGESICVTDDSYRTCINGTWSAQIFCNPGFVCSNGACIQLDQQQQQVETTTTSLKPNGESCTTDNECASGYCVHYICRPSKPYCGDNYCDPNENCAEDDDACPSGYLCTNGCQKYNVSEVKEEEKVFAYEISELVELLKNKKLKHGLAMIIGKNISNLTKELLINNTKKIEEHIKLKRKIVIDKEKSKTILITQIIYNASEKAINFVVYETIPKTFARNIKDLRIITKGNLTIIEEDPEILVLFPIIFPDQEINITYEIYEIKSKTVLNDFKKPIIFVEQLKAIVCGDKICEGNEYLTCPEDCGIITSAAIYIIVLVILIIVIFFLFTDTGKNMVSKFVTNIQVLLKEVKKKKHKKGEEILKQLKLKKKKFKYRYEG